MSESPVQELTATEDIAPARTKAENNDDPGDCSVLYIEDLPTYWNIATINTFLRDITTSQKIIDNISYLIVVKLNNPANGIYNKGGSFLVKFTSPYFCRLAYSEWLPIIESKQLKISYDFDNLYERKKGFQKPFIKSHIGSSSLKEYPPPKRQKLSHSVDENSNETYGLSMQFLKDLNIKLPLGRKLFVSNLNPEVTENKLREVFSYAGLVVDVNLFKKEKFSSPKYSAKILYDHPVEAVQAIAMFNNQKLYTWPMMVKMYNKPTDLPDGLSDIGRGLGPNGQPLRGIRNYLELQEVKKMIMRENNNTKNFGGPNSNTQNITPFAQQEKSGFNQMATSMGVQNPMALQPDNTVFNQMANTGMGISASMALQPDNSMYSIANTGMGVQTPMPSQIPVTPVPVPVPVPAPNQQSVNAFGQSSMVNPFTMSSVQMLQNLCQQNSANSVQQAISMLLQNKMNTNTTGQSSDQSNSSEWRAHSDVGASNQNDYKQPEYSMTENKNYSNDSQSYDYGQRNYSDSSRYEDRDKRDSRSKSSRDEDKSNKDTSDMLIFKNLPRSVTLQALKNKMQEVGEVKFAEMTGQGRAIVRYLHSRDAERCIKLFNKSKVDGQTIDVRYF